MKSILDPEFQYVPSYETDVRKTFAKIREAQQRRQEQQRAGINQLEKEMEPINERL